MQISRGKAERSATTAAPIATLVSADIAAAAAVLAVFFSRTVTQRAVIDTPLEHVIYEAVAAIMMLVIARRMGVAWLGLPVAPQGLRRSLPFSRFSRACEVFCLTSITVVLAVLMRRIGERGAGTIWPVGGRDSKEKIVDMGCRSYNDPACTGDSATIDIVEVFVASVGEELAYRFALLVIIARFTGVRVAIVVQAVIWALSHTGFEQGYGATAVIGLFGMGVVYAISVVATGSIWPAMIAHGLHSLGIAALDHDLDAVMWVVVVANGLGAISLAFAISMPLARFIVRRR